MERSRPAASVRGLRAHLAPYADRIAIAGTGITVVGFVGHFVGILARSAGDLDDAVELLTAALARSEVAGFVPFARNAAHELARMLRLRGRPGDEVAATALDGRAARLTGDLQMPPPTA